MGNKLGRRRQVVDEKYTKPQGLYQHRDIDHKKLRKLILDSKLAPCYPGDEECAFDREECPICFLSKEEKGMEQIEEQKVIEAKIRMQQQERQDEEERMQKRQSICSSSRLTTPAEVECCEIPNSTVSGQDDEFVSTQIPCALPATRGPSYSRQNRNDDFDLDLEDIMVMEAIWLSIQEHGPQRSSEGGGNIPSDLSYCEYGYASRQTMAHAEGSPSAGLACAAAALAERQHTNRDFATSSGINCTMIGMLPPLLPPPGLHTGERMVENYSPENWIEVSPGSGRAVAQREDGEWNVEHGSEIAEAGTSYAGSDFTVDAGPVLPHLDGIGMPAGHLIPESFEEQMMLAMAVSLAEARARRNTEGMMAWQ